MLEEHVKLNHNDSEKPNSTRQKSSLEGMLYGCHDAEEKMLSMTMGCDGPHSDEVLERNKQNDKQQFHQVQRQENVK